METLPEVDTCNIVPSYEFWKRSQKRFRERSVFGRQRDFLPISSAYIQDVR